MPPPNNPLICRTTMVFSRDTRIFNMTHHFLNTGGWNSGEMLALAQGMLTWWNLHLKLNLSNLVFLTMVQARLYDPDNPLAVDFPVSPPVPGSSSGPPASANATSTISWRTGLAGRKFRGRSFLPGYIEAHINNDDTVNSAQIASNAASAIYFLSGWGGTGVQPVIFHRATNTYTPITTYVIENLLDSMRRRLPSRGR